MEHTLKISILLLLFTLNAYSSEDLECTMKIGGKEISINVPVNLPGENLEPQVLIHKENKAVFSAEYVLGVEAVRLNLDFKTKKKNSKKSLKVTKTSFVFEKHARKKYVKCEFDSLFNDDITRMTKVFKLAKDNVNAFYGNERLVYFAARRDRLKLFNYLYELGANPVLLNNNGNNALVGSVLSGNLEMVKVLVTKHQEVVNQLNSKEWTPLMFAANLGNPKITKTLLEAGALLNNQDKLGRTALMLAAKKGYVEVAKSLIESGASLDLKRTNGMTAYMLAHKYGFSSIEKALLKAGASSNLTNENSNSYLSDDWDWDPENEDFTF